MQNKKFSFQARLRSFKYAFQGLGALIRNEHNARIHLFAAICVMIAGIIFSVSTVEWLVISLAIGAVFAAEAFNSSIEALSDLVSPGYNEKIKKAKDFAAAAVLITAVAAATAGLIIFIPKIAGLF